MRKIPARTLFRKSRKESNRRMIKNRQMQDRFILINRTEHHGSDEQLGLSSDPLEKSK